jgi:rhamnosyl/mannosyltransferase
MPSTLRAEAYGVAIVEAMVMAKPIASTDMAGSGVPWVNRHASTGFKVPVRQPERLAESLRLLLKDPELRRWFGEAARACYAEEFNIKLMTDKTIDLYRALQPAA